VAQTRHSGVFVVQTQVWLPASLSLTPGTHGWNDLYPTAAAAFQEVMPAVQRGLSMLSSPTLPISLI
jgi:hypothetical protein